MYTTYGVIFEGLMATLIYIPVNLVYIKSFYNGNILTDAFL